MAVYKNDANLQGLWLLNNDLLDYTPNNNDLTDSGGITFNAADKQEGSHSADFEASSSQQASITDGSQTGLDLGSVGSFCFWVKPESTGANMVVISKYTAAGNQRSYFIRFETSAKIGLIFSGNGTTTTQAIANTALSAGTWYHVAAVADGTDIRIYIDSVLDITPVAYTAGFFNTSAAFILGSIGSNYYDGLLDEVGVFNRALSSTEVADIFNDGIQDPPSGGQPTSLRGTTVPRLRQWQPRGIRG
jgi:hypothetical protein